jgi:hypothetical protein
LAYTEGRVPLALSFSTITSSSASIAYVHHVHHVRRHRLNLAGGQLTEPGRQPIRIQLHRLCFLRHNDAGGNSKKGEVTVSARRIMVCWGVFSCCNRPQTDRGRSLCRGRGTRRRSPRTAVLPRPYQHIYARPLVPRAMVLPRPREHRHVAV